MIRVAVAAEPDNPAYLDSLGWVLFKLKKFEERFPVHGTRGCGLGGTQRKGQSSFYGQVLERGRNPFEQGC